MLNDGYRVFSVIDAAGAWNRYEADAGPRAYDQRRAEPVTTFGLARELQEDWKSQCADAMLNRFKENLSEYGFVLKNYWNARGRRATAGRAWPRG
jgi:hypothetical protein